MNAEDFEKLACEAMDALPDHVVKALDNVVVVIEEISEEGDVLGLYVGVPRSERWGDNSGQVPDQIILYRKTIVDECSGDPQIIREEIARTLWHEIGHHLGWDDDALEVSEHDKGWHN